MLFSQTFNIGLTALRRNKFRSLLTILGIIIGIAAVVGIVSVGGGAKYLVIAEFDRIGGATTIIYFRQGHYQNENGEWIRNKNPEHFEINDANEILANCPSIQSISPERSTHRTVSHGGNSRDTRIQGVTSVYSDVHNWEIEIGRFIQKVDLERRELVCVIGSKIQTDLFGGRDPIGEELKIGDHRFTIVGVLREKGNKMATQGWDERVLMPITVMRGRLVSKRDRRLVMWCQAKNYDVVDQAIAEIEVALDRLHPRRDEKTFKHFAAKMVIDQVGNVSRVLQALLGGVASIALFVGGIGIMNIMLVSVSERTQEIGLRKAIGAKNFDIRLQFLIESILLSVWGGVIGILIGGGVALGAAWAMTEFVIKEANWPGSVSLSAALIAFAVSTLIGVIFGIYPAIKAARLQPTEALRYE